MADPILQKQAEDLAKIKGLADKAGGDFNVPTGAGWVEGSGFTGYFSQLGAEFSETNTDAPAYIGNRATATLSAENINNLSAFVVEENSKNHPPGSDEAAVLDKAIETLEDWAIDAAPVGPQQTPSGIAGTAAEEQLTQARRTANQALAGKTSKAEGTTEDIASESAAIVHTAGQCFLLYNLAAFSQYHKTLLGTPSGHDFYETDSGINKSHGYYSKKLHKTRVFLIDENTPGTQVVNKLTMKKGADALVDIKTHEYAQLMPLLRIYKVYRDPKTSGSEEVVEIEFTSNTSLEGIGTPASIGHINTTEESRYTRGSEAGVLSFDWRYIGTDPYTATREVEATLKLTAQHFSSLVKGRPGEVVGSNPSKQRLYRYLDLIVQADCRDNATPPPIGGYSPECYEIRVVVGYQNPGTNAIMDERIKENIPCQKDILALIPSDHSFDYKDDGSIELTINLKGRTEQLMNNKAMNILFPSGGSDLTYIPVVDPKIDDWSVEAVAGTSRGGGSINLQVARDELKDLKKKKAPSEEEKELIKAYEREISRTYVREKQFFLSQIFDTLESKKAVHYYKMTEAEFDTFVRWKTDLAVTNYPPPIDLAKVMTGGAPTRKADVEAQSRAEPSTSESHNQATLDEVIKGWRKGEAALPIDVKRGISYFFLGDLLASVLASVLGEASYSPSFRRRLRAVAARIGTLTSTATGDAGPEARGHEAMADRTGASSAPAIRSPSSGARRGPTVPANTALENFKMLLGNITVEIKNSGTTGPTTVNLAHIPISVDAFTQFMIDNVLSKDIDQYPYFKFVDNVLSSLVTDLLGSNCLGGLVSSKPRPQTNLVLSPKDLEKNSIFNAIFTPWKVLRVDAIDYQNPVFDTCQDLGAAAVGLSEYFIITSSDTDMSHLKGERLDDTRRGLLHLHFGREAGLVKHMKFNKTDQEFLPESRFVSEGSNVIFNQLANVYDVSVEMVGNNLFKIGQYVYIEARALGAGPSWGWSETADGETTARSWSNIMGLGGYHLITEVGASINATGGYNTTIKARWVSGGVREDWGDWGPSAAYGGKYVL